ncbi:MAG: glycosyltransferase family 9 protein [Desulfobacteraceae bacterium]|nr:glycosyltransferase family 9 protein [Desulfobacteraceae bacterium]
MKVLIIKLGALGDVINTLPLAINIKEHLNAEIHWLVAPLSLPLVNEHKSVDRAIIFDKHNLKKSLPDVFKQIRQTKYDIALDLQRLFKSGLFCMAAKADRRIGFDKKRCKEMSWLFPFERIASADPNTHMLNQYMEFAKHLGIEPDKISWDIPWTKSKEQVKPDLDYDYIVLNIGATKPANRWKPEYFAKLADMIEKQTHFKSVITGGNDDKQYGKEIETRAHCQIKNLCGKTSLKELVIVVANAECVVSCDTGPMHLAAALGTSLIALFGPSDPYRTGPFHGTIIQEKIDCSPCNKKKCKDPICMEKIKPEHVMDKLIEKVIKK